MLILLAGDSHGDSTYAQNVAARAQREGADAVFQLGDFGYGWRWGQRKVTGEPFCEFTANISKFAKRTGVPWYWLGGNHENYDAIELFMEQLEPEANGTYQVEPDVFYVPRGLVLCFGGKLFLCCGGACSIDQNYRMGEERQTGRKSYWTQELITQKDIDLCEEQGTMDALFTHDFPIECNIIDRHLNPGWGEAAQRETIQNRTNVSTILNASKAKRLFHGHLHIRYTEVIETAIGTRVMVVGLDCNGTSMKHSTYLLDTEDVESVV